MKKALAAKAKHEEWLSKHGLSKKQLRDKKVANLNWKSDYAEGLTSKCGRKYASITTDGNSGATFKKSIMEVAYKESPAVQRQILEKAMQVAPICNKGGYQYITEKSDLTDLGRKK